MTDRTTAGDMEQQAAKVVEQLIGAFTVGAMGAKPFEQMKADTVAAVTAFARQVASLENEACAKHFEQQASQQHNLWANGLGDEHKRLCDEYTRAALAIRTRHQEGDDK